MNRVLFDLDDNHSLLTDGQQWMVARKSNKDKYTNIAYIASNKLIIHRVIREKNIDLSEDGERQLDELPLKFRDFIEAEGGKVDDPD
jgi:hypothetical protein